MIYIASPPMGRLAKTMLSWFPGREMVGRLAAQPSPSHLNSEPRPCEGF